jgi:hypothetical protein
VALEQRAIVFQLTVVLDEPVELLLFRVYDNCDDNDEDVCILPSVPYAHPCHDAGAVQTKRRQRIIKRQ